MKCNYSYIGNQSNDYRYSYIAKKSNNYRYKLQVTVIVTCNLRYVTVTDPTLPGSSRMVSLISLSYSMPVFSANSFGLFFLLLPKWHWQQYFFTNFQQLNQVLPYISFIFSKLKEFYPKLRSINFIARHLVTLVRLTSELIPSL